MRRVTYFVASTIDGFVAGPNGGDPTMSGDGESIGPDDFFTVGEDYFKHIVTTYPETLPGPARDALGISDAGSHFDTVLEGRGSFELGLDAGIPDAYPHLRHVVFSRTLTSAPGTDVEIVASDPVENVRALKQESGKGIWVVGGGAIAGVLYPEIDELIVKLNPVTIGRGIPLWGGDSAFDATAWERTGCTPLASGVVFLTYSRKPSAR